MLASGWAGKEYLYVSYTTYLLLSKEKPLVNTFRQSVLVVCILILALAQNRRFIANSHLEMADVKSLEYSTLKVRAGIRVGLRTFEIRQVNLNLLLSPPFCLI